MSRYMLISSREPFTCPSTNALYDLARELSRQGHQVTLFLVENGVMVARAGVYSKLLQEAYAAGVEILAEEFSLRERAIPLNRLGAGIESARLEVVLDALVERVKTVWH